MVSVVVKKMRIDRLARLAHRASSSVIVVVLLAVLVFAVRRLLPWMLVPSIPWQARLTLITLLLSVCVENAVFLGWPVGWALAASSVRSLREHPRRAMKRLALHCVWYALVLFATSFASAQDAALPGRLVRELLASSKDECAERVSSTSLLSPTEHGASAESQPVPSVVVPLLGATWLCGGARPLLVGRAPFTKDAIYTARDLTVSDDLRRVDLVDARVLTMQSASNREEGLGSASVASLRGHFRNVSLRGFAPFARASAVPPVARAVTVVSSGLAASNAALFALGWLSRQRARKVNPDGALGFGKALLIGLAGPLVAMVALHAIDVRIPDDRRGVWLTAMAAVPFAAAASPFAVAALVALVDAWARTKLTKRREPTASP